MASGMGGSINPNTASDGEWSVVDPQRTSVNRSYRKAYLRGNFEGIEQLSGDLFAFRIRDDCKWGEFLQNHVGLPSI